MFILLGICIITIFLNPILFFIRFEIWDRKKYIELMGLPPTIKDFWKYISNGDDYYIGYRTWWWPVVGNFVFIYYVLYLVCRPLNSIWESFIKWFGDIKV